MGTGTSIPVPGGLTLPIAAGRVDYAGIPLKTRWGATKAAAPRAHVP